MSDFIGMLDAAGDHLSRRLEESPEGQAVHAELHDALKKAMKHYPAFAYADLLIECAAVSIAATQGRAGAVRFLREYAKSVVRGHRCRFDMPQETRQ